MHLHPLPAFADNYIWTVRREATAPAVIVDPGESGPVLRAFQDDRPPLAVLLTHHHNDHIGGVADLLHRWPGLRVFAPFDDRIAYATDRVADGDLVSIGDWRFETIAVPGHTVSHIAFHGHGLLFCGDTLFSLGCGRLFEGSPAQMLHSLDRLAALPDDSRVCCGHEYTVANAAFARTVEPDNAALQRRQTEAMAMRNANRPTVPSTLAAEHAANPFLRIDAPAVRAAIAQRLGREPTDRVEAFAELRRWKDGFNA